MGLLGDLGIDLDLGQGDLRVAAGPLEIVLRLVREEPATAGAAGATAFAGVWGLRWLAKRLLPFAVVLYARIRKVDLAEHPARAALLGWIRELPGITTADLVARTRLNKGTALHHLRTLQRAGLARSSRVGRDRAWTLPGAAPLDAPAQQALHARSRALILEIATARPGVSQAELARELGLTRATVAHHVAALREAGLLDVRREGLRTGCHARAGPPFAAQPHLRA